MRVQVLKGTSLTVPTTLVSLSVPDSCKDSSITGAENVMSLGLSDGAVTHCPRLVELGWNGHHCTNEKMPFTNTPTTLTYLRMNSHTIADDFVFPTSLRKVALLRVKVPIGHTLLNGLTNLVDLEIHFDPDAVKNQVPLDLSPLVSLTNVDAHDVPVAKLPTSLKECELTLFRTFDFSALTQLTFLKITIKGWPKVTFPTQLETLWIDGMMDMNNIKDVALKEFWCMSWWVKWT